MVVIKGNNMEVQRLLKNKNPINTRIYEFILMRIEWKNVEHISYLFMKGIVADMKEVWPLITKDIIINPYHYNQNEQQKHSLRTRVITIRPIVANMTPYCFLLKKS